MIEIRLKGENYKNGWVVIIPYEVNERIFKELKKNDSFPNIDLYFPNFGRGDELGNEKIDILIKNCNLFIENMDRIFNELLMPIEVGGFDGYVIDGFVSCAENIDKNYIEGEIIIDYIALENLINHIKSKAEEAKIKKQKLLICGD